MLLHWNYVFNGSKLQFSVCAAMSIILFSWSPDPWIFGSGSKSRIQIFGSSMDSDHIWIIDLNPVTRISEIRIPTLNFNARKTKLTNDFFFNHSDGLWTEKMRTWIVFRFCERRRIKRAEQIYFLDLVYPGMTKSIAIFNQILSNV